MTYQDVTNTLSVPWCRECAQGDHRQGFSDRRVHWSDRRINRQGLRRFLLLAAPLIVHDWKNQPTWAQLYLANVWATDVALHQLHIRFPARYSSKNRTKVRYLMERDNQARTNRFYARARNWAKE